MNDGAPMMTLTQGLLSRVPCISTDFSQVTQDTRSDERVLGESEVIRGTFWASHTARPKSGSYRTLFVVFLCRTAECQIQTLLGGREDAALEGVGCPLLASKKASATRLFRLGDSY